MPLLVQRAIDRANQNLVIPTLKAELLYMPVDRVIRHISRPIDHHYLGILLNCLYLTFSAVCKIFAISNICLVASPFLFLAWCLSP
jgi:hypothetical protein